MKYLNSINILISIIGPIVIGIVNKYWFNKDSFNVTVSNPKNKYNTFKEYKVSEMEYYTNLFLLLIILFFYFIFHKHYLAALVIYIIFTLSIYPFISLVIRIRKFSKFKYKKINYYIIGNRDQDDFYICQKFNELKSTRNNKKYLKIKKSEVSNFENVEIQLSNFEYKSTLLFIIKYIFIKIKKSFYHKKK